MLNRDGIDEFVSHFLEHDKYGNTLKTQAYLIGKGQSKYKIYFCE